MQTTRFHLHWPSKVASKPLLKPVLFSMAALFLLCLPLNQVPLNVEGIQHPSVALTFLLVITVICFGLFEVARQKRFSTTSITFWLAVASVLGVIPAFYAHSAPSAAIWHVTGIVLAFALFSTLQQFSFNHVQRQYLLWLPLLSGWIVSIPYVVPNILSLVELQEVYTHPTWLDKDTLSVTLLTSLALSAYLLARTKAYKRNLVPLHFLLFATPLITIIALMTLKQPWLITITLLCVILPQPFLFKFSPRLHHGIWNLAVLLGFLTAGIIGALPHAALFSPLFAESEASLLGQIFTLLSSAQFQGLGLGQSQTSLLILNLNAQEHLAPYAFTPSWLMMMAAEGGIAVWLSLGVVITMTFRRLLDAPNGTRLMLFAILLPALLGMTATAFAQSNPILLVLFIVLLYWVDNLTARYSRHITRPSLAIKVIASTLLTLSTITVVSSVYLGQQAAQAHGLSTYKLTQYQFHPWWKTHFEDEVATRVFLKNVESNDLRAQRHYLARLTQKVSSSPSVKGYQNLIDVAVLTNNMAIAHQIKEEASQLFPHHTFQPKRFE
ncbi:lipid A core--O-antigen ligase [Enterovibrio sp. ZSDZ35]|uniref:Lipid A core--O-antigen ligase n=1 Tax=Enterovibrio qingdaonensis TaxID=2899818 RepID=A0ABT5QMF4_9GAMM|nr:Wzy polymerase domain-containing protein [Enterovibrio sp. ZSDZ35]MDD1782171.1 lipid A core--O-antigen ligase [Enterovibrio sp. ZSDZ35]